MTYLVYEKKYRLLHEYKHRKSRNNWLQNNVPTANAYTLVNFDLKIVLDRIIGIASKNKKKKKLKHVGLKNYNVFAVCVQ